MGRKSETVWKRGGVYWHRDPVTSNRRSTGYRTKRAAEAHHAQRELIAADPNHAAKDAATIREWVKKMLAAKKAAKTEGTLHMYSTKAGHLVRVLGPDFQLQKLTPGVVDDYIQQRQEEGAAQSTIYREIPVTLNQIIKAAKRAGVCDVDVKGLLPVDWSVKYKPRTRNLSPREAADLLAILPEEHSAFVAFVLATGARLGEANRAEPEDLDRVDMVCRIRGTKTASSARSVPVLPQLGDLWLRVTKFWTEHGRAPRWPDTSKGLILACRRLGIEPVTTNDLRRTHASWLIHQGVDQGLVSRVLGHRDGTMVSRVYGQVTGRQLSALVSGQISTGTKSTQFDFETSGESQETAEKGSRPLGGMADAGDLKSATHPGKTAKSARLHRRAPPENDPECWWSVQNRHSLLALAAESAFARHALRSGVAA